MGLPFRSPTIKRKAGELRWWVRALVKTGALDALILSKVLITTEIAGERFPSGFQLGSLDANSREVKKEEEEGISLVERLPWRSSGNSSSASRKIVTALGHGSPK